MSKTMRKTPIEFSFRFLTEKAEYDYTNQWTALGMREFGEKSCNKVYKYLEPIICQDLRDAMADIRFIKNDFLLYDNNGNRIARERLDDGQFIFERDVKIWEYKDDYVLKFICQRFVSYFIMMFRLDQGIFDLETWSIENLNHPFSFVICIETERQVGPGNLVSDDDGRRRWVDGTSVLSPEPHISFSDDTDAMAYKLKFL